MIPEYRIYELDELLDELTMGTIIRDYDRCREYRAIYDIDSDLVDSIAELKGIDTDGEDGEDVREMLNLTIRLRDRYKTYI